MEKSVLTMGIVFIFMPMQSVKIVEIYGITIIHRESGIIMKIPVNEMGVVSLFSQYAQSLGYVIMEIQAPFPDATLYDIETGNLLRIEFEYKSKNFRKHKHDPNKCDLIICWEHNWNSCPLSVISLDIIHGQEPIETVYDLQEKIKLLEARNNYLEQKIKSIESARSRINILRDELDDANFKNLLLRKDHRIKKRRDI